MSSGMSQLGDLDDEPPWIQSAIQAGFYYKFLDFN